MRPLAHRGVPPTERESSPIGQTPDWENVRIFLEVVRRGSFRSASEYLDQSVNMLRRRIHELEHQLGTMLLTRHVDGVRITAEGAQILAAARQMEGASFGLVRARDRAVTSLSGEVKVAVSEGLGAFWLAPRLVEFQRSYPGLLIDLVCAMRSVDVLRLEAEASVQLTKPTSADLKVMKLGRLHVIPFVGRPYVETYGLPKSREELLKHRIVLQVGEELATNSNYDLLFPGVPQPGFVAMRTNVSSTHYWAIAKGAGIGWLPTYAGAIGARVLPLDIDPSLRFSFDVWLTFHAGVSNIPRVRRTIDWIVESFDSKHFPWFGDQFIHPHDLPRQYRGAPLVNLFEGFAAAEWTSTDRVTPILADNST
jgi:DNA-binding transcriptional LysR family regulator